MASILKVNTIQDATNSNTAMTIDSSGRILYPSIPHISFQGNPSQGNYTIGNGETIGATNDGNPAWVTDEASYSTYGVSINDITYNSATGKLTLPITGLYVTYFQIYRNTSNSYRLNMLLTLSGGSAQIISAGHSPSGVGTTSTSHMFKATANSTIHFTQTSGADRTNYGGGYHEYGYIYLVG